MRAEENNRVSYRFGDFEVYPESLEIRKNGVRLKLREQVFRILVVMLEQPGKLVTRDELRQKLWPQDTFVDFDKSLNTAVNKLRDVLCDSAADPHFLETIPRHGYRFVAAVEKIEAATMAAAAGMAMAAGVASQTQIVSEAHQFQTPQVPSRNHRLWPWLLLAAIFLTTALLFIDLGTRPPQTPALGTPVQVTNDGIPKNELVTDGIRVYYAAPTHQNLTDWRAFAVSAQGGEPHLLSPGSEAFSPFAISADHTQLMMGLSAIRQNNDSKTANSFWSQPLAGGAARALSLKAQDASWSPDGSQIIFANANHIGLARTDGATIRMFPDLPGMATGLRWSPTGNSVRFTLHYGAAQFDKAIWELSLNTGKARPLFPQSKNQQADGEWTPDGKLYLFSQINNGVSQIWALSERTARFADSQQQAVQLTTGPMQTFLPTPTPDGKRILFYGVTKRSKLLKMNQKSGQFEIFLPGVSEAYVHYSSDEKWITYCSYPEMATWRAEADGSQRLQLSPPNMRAILPVMSPDGNRISFLGILPGESAFNYVINRDGSNLQAFIPVEPRQIADSSWAPDSKSLVLGGIDTATGQKVLYRFDFATRALNIMPGSEGLWSPRWSRDGRFIAALAWPVSKLMLYDLATRRQTQLTPNAANYPIWAQQGQYIYFRYGDNNQAWCRIGLHRREIERIAELNDAGVLPATPARGMPTWINWWVGLAPDNSLIVPSEGGSIEIYSAPLTKN